MNTNLGGKHQLVIGHGYIDILVIVNGGYKWIKLKQISNFKSISKKNPILYHDLHRNLNGIGYFDIYICASNMIRIIQFKQYPFTSLDVSILYADNF